jgi:hypothetical protein
MPNNSKTSPYVSTFVYPGLVSNYLQMAAVTATFRISITVTSTTKRVSASGIIGSARGKRSLINPNQITHFAM